MAVHTSLFFNGNVKEGAAYDGVGAVVDQVLGGCVPHPAHATLLISC